MGRDWPVIGQHVVRPVPKPIVRTEQRYPAEMAKVAPSSLGATFAMEC